MSENEKASSEESVPTDVLDWDAALEQNGVGAEATGQLAELFLQESQKQLAEIREAIGSDDASALRRAAHTMKGSAAVFAAQRTSEAARRLKMIAADGDLSQAEAVYEELVREFDRLCPALTARAKNASKGGSS